MDQKVAHPRKKPIDDKGYFEILSKAVFNAGFNYQVVRNKWEGIKEVFCEFKPEILSNWTVDEVATALESPKIIRNPKKVKAIVSNANVFLDIVEKYGSFEDYLRSFREKPYEERQRILSKQFKWLGPTGTHFFLWSIGEDPAPGEEVFKTG